jgi:putative mRNA 3-end processing factor
VPGDLLIPTESGLYCPEGDFHVDPWKPVPRAVITHAHSDHAVFGCGSYLCAGRGSEVLRLRVGASADVQGAAFGQATAVGRARVSLHPAGHVLGSAQVRVEAPGHPVWVVSGDYKTEPDATCDAFEPVRCGVFLTESTFGLPIYRWPPVPIVAEQINAWWRSSAAEGVTTVVLAYSLGKAQRVLSLLDPSIGPIGLHGAPMRFDAAYRDAGINLPPVVHASHEHARLLKGGGLIIAPPAAAGSTWIRKFAGKGGLATGQVSGWMRVRGRRRWRASDRGFVLSDHADWDGLNRAIDATGAARVGVTHGYSGPLARWLRERGLESFVVPTRWEGEAAPGEPGDGEAEPTVQASQAPAAERRGDDPTPGGSA